jgi:hypothetical protein
MERVSSSIGMMKEFDVWLGWCFHDASITQPNALRFAAMKELAQYVAPKHKAVEVRGPEGSPVPLPAPIITPEEFEAIARRIDAET